MDRPPDPTPPPRRPEESDAARGSPDSGAPPHSTPMGPPAMQIVLTPAGYSGPMRPAWATAIGVISIVMACLTILLGGLTLFQAFWLPMQKRMFATWSMPGGPGAFPPGTASAGSMAANDNASPRSGTGVNPATQPAAASADSPGNPAPAGLAASGGAGSPFGPWADYPDWLPTAFIAQGIVSVLLGVVPLLGGILLLAARPSARGWLIGYAIAAFLLLVGSAIADLCSFSMMAIGQSMYFFLCGVPFPIVVIVFMFMRRQRAWFESLRAPATNFKPPPLGR